MIVHHEENHALNIQWEIPSEFTFTLFLRLVIPLLFLIVASRICRRDNGKQSMLFHKKRDSQVCQRLRKHMHAGEALQTKTQLVDRIKFPLVSNH